MAARFQAGWVQLVAHWNMGIVTKDLHISMFIIPRKKMASFQTHNKSRTAARPGQKTTLLTQEEPLLLSSREF